MSNEFTSSPEDNYERNYLTYSIDFCFVDERLQRFLASSGVEDLDDEADENFELLVSDRMEYGYGHKISVIIFSGESTASEYNPVNAYESAALMLFEWLDFHGLKEVNFIDSRIQTFDRDGDDGDFDSITYEVKSFARNLDALKRVTMIDFLRET